MDFYVTPQGGIAVIAGMILLAGILLGILLAIKEDDDDGRNDHSDN
jgi:hypothetical protein